MCDLKKEFVTKEISIILKELSFDDYTLAGYDKDSRDVLKLRKADRYISYFAKYSASNEHITKAPTWQSCLKWLRKKHELIVDTVYFFNGKHWTWSVMDTKLSEEDKKSIFMSFLDTDIFSYSTYEEAQEAGILYALNLLKDGLKP